MPEQLFKLTPTEFTDMYFSKLHYENVEYDKELQRTAWFSSLIMSSSGNYSKKGVDPKKLYTPQYDENGNYIETKNSVFTPIDREVKEQKLNELVAKFNKKDKVTKVE